MIKSSEQQLTAFWVEFVPIQPKQTVAIQTLYLLHNCEAQYFIYEWLYVQLFPFASDYKAQPHALLFMYVAT